MASATTARAARSQLGLTRRCPKGYVLRKPYTRRFQSSTKKSGYIRHRGNRTFRVYPRATAQLVKAACIKNKGLPGKGPRSGKGIGPLREGELSRFGYGYYYPEGHPKVGERQSAEDRHEALRRAIQEYGVLNVFQKLNAIANLTVRLKGSAKSVHEVFVADRKWIQANYTVKKAM